MIIAIYGESGSGKTTACELFKKHGFLVINADKIGREILEKGSVGLELVIKEFGEEYLSNSGELDRKKLGRLVFSDDFGLKRLNNITIPLITERIKNIIRENKDKNIIIDGAVLYKTEIVNICDMSVLIKSDHSASRLKKRDNLSGIEADNRLKSQIFDGKADIIIENNYNDKEKFYEKLEEVFLCRIKSICSK